MFFALIPGLATLAALCLWRIVTTEVAAEVGGKPVANAGADWRDGALEGVGLWAVLLFGMTEGLGAAGRLAAPELLICWSLAACGAGWLAARAIRREGWRPIGLLQKSWIAAAIAWLLLATLVLGLVSAPNNYDGMTYHLARVMHWLQNGNVNFFPTSIARQVQFTPGSEYVLLHLRALAGSDRYSHMMQWGAFAVSLLAVSRIGDLLSPGNGVRAALVAATVPMALLQAVSVQNDLAVAALILGFVARLLAARARWLLRDDCIIGLFLGLAILTKTTALFYAFPFLLWHCLSRLSQKRLRAVPGLLLIAALVIAINGAHTVRNLRAYGAVLPVAQRADAGGTRLQLTPDRHDLRTLASNIVRCTAINFSSPWDGFNADVENAVRRIHQVIGISPDDPATSWLETDDWGRHTTFLIPRLRADENFSGAPLHGLLLVAALILLLLKTLPSRKASGALYPYALCAGAAFLLICLLLRWQPWHNRLLMPLALLSAPLIAWALAAWKPAVSNGLLILLFVTGNYFVLHHESHPLRGGESVLRTPRESQYFIQFRGLENPLRAAAEVVRGNHWRCVGLLTGDNAYEYPIWPLLSAPESAIRLIHVGAGDAASVKPRDCAPQAIMVVGLHEAVIPPGFTLGSPIRFDPAPNQPVSAAVSVYPVLTAEATTPSASTAD